jgi:hypothetical protein
MKYLAMKFNDAMTLMGQQHVDTKPNTGFKQQLRDFEK